MDASRNQRARDRLLPNVRKAREFSNEQLSIVRKKLDECDLPASISIFVVGSFARQEATKNSDFDYLIYAPKRDDHFTAVAKSKVSEVLCNQSIAQPATGGAFGDSCCIEDHFVKNIGGNRESNDSLTRRMLLLLESDSVTGPDVLNCLRKKVIGRYISESMTEHGIARFLLNDLVKFYRTMCVDFEYKTVEAGKDWGVRNIKLAFSRKLIYFSGVLAVAETAQRSWKQKQEIVGQLMSITPTLRLEQICGSACEPALQSYDTFIEMLDDSEKKESFANVTADRVTHTNEFRDLKNEAQHFSWQLARLLQQVYPASHPIHHALVF